MGTEERPTKIRKLSHEQSGIIGHDPLQEAMSERRITASDGPDDQLELQVDEQSSQHATTADGEEQGKPNNVLPVPEQTAPLIESVDGGQADPPLSKSQQKKLRKKAEWESGREERKLIRKEKLQAKRKRKREAKQDAIANGLPLSRPCKTPQKANQLPVTFLIDCDFDNLMRDGERISLGSQLTRCYSDNKGARFRAHVTICSWGGELKKRFETVLKSTHESWRGMRFLESNFVLTAEKAKHWMVGEEGGKLAGVFSKYADLDEAALEPLKQEGEVVYLSSEADEDLTELKPYSTYIIGGLVDKNREKGICYKRATEAGIRTAKLPIGEYMDMQSRKVLATNHVNEIMLKWLECGDWGEAFLQVIPKRKGGKLKGASNEEEEEGTETTQAGGHNDSRVEKEVEAEC